MHIASRCRLCFLQQKFQSLSGFKLIASSKMSEALSGNCHVTEYIKPLKSMYMPQAGQMEKTKYRERHCRTFFMFHHNPHKTGLPHFQHCYPGSDEHEHLAANPAALFATTFNTSQLLMCHVRPSVWARWHVHFLPACCNYCKCNIHKHAFTACRSFGAIWETSNDVMRKTCDLS